MTGPDWSAIGQLGLGRLRLAPETLWAMTPAEFRTALEGAGLVAPAGLAMDRGRLRALMAAHPDRKGT